MKFKEWLNTYFTEFFTGRYEITDKPELGNWSKNELKKKFKKIINEVN